MNRCTTQKLFVYIALVFGMILIMLIPPMQSPDEDSHFKKAYVLAEGNFYPSVENGKKGHYLPEELMKYSENAIKSIGNMEYKFNYADIIRDERTAIVYDKQVFTGFSTMSTNPIGHLIPAVGIMLGKLFAKVAGKEPSFIFLLYFARIVTLLFYIVMISTAIRITPILKKTFGVLGLMPMALYMASSVSYDSLLIGLAFILTAICIRLFYDEKTENTWKTSLLVGFIAFVFYAIKIIYLPMCLLYIVALWEKESGTLKEKVVRGIKAIMPMVLLFVVCYISTVFIPNMLADPIKQTAGGGVSLTQQQMNFITEDPIRFFGVLYHSVKSGRYYYVSSTVGLFGLVDTYMFGAFTYAYVVVAFMIGLFDISLSDIKVKWLERTVAFLSVSAGVFGAFLAMYLLWTPQILGVGGNWIEGVQGRYFLPLLPPVFLILGNGFIRKNTMLKKIGNELLDSWMLPCVTILAIASLTILLRYWV